MKHGGQKDLTVSFYALTAENAYTFVSLFRVQPSTA
jgi:hypothetical protein